MMTSRSVLLYTPVPIIFVALCLSFSTISLSISSACRVIIKNLYADFTPCRLRFAINDEMKLYRTHMHTGL